MTAQQHDRPPTDLPEICSKLKLFIYIFFICLSRPLHIVCLIKHCLFGNLDTQQQLLLCISLHMQNSTASAFSTHIFLLTRKMRTGTLDDWASEASCWGGIGHIETEGYTRGWNILRFVYFVFVYVTFVVDYYNMSQSTVLLLFILI